MDEEYHQGRHDSEGGADLLGSDDVGMEGDAQMLQILEAAWENDKETRDIEDRLKALCVVLGNASSTLYGIVYDKRKADPGFNMEETLGDEQQRNTPSYNESLPTADEAKPIPDNVDYERFTEHVVKEAFKLLNEFGGTLEFVAKIDKLMFLINGNGPDSDEVLPAYGGSTYKHRSSDGLLKDNAYMHDTNELFKNVVDNDVQTTAYWRFATNPPLILRRHGDISTLMRHLVLNGVLYFLTKLKSLELWTMNNADSLAKAPADAAMEFAYSYNTKPTPEFVKEVVGFLQNGMKLIHSEAAQQIGQVNDKKELEEYVDTVVMAINNSAVQNANTDQGLILHEDLVQGLKINLIFSVRKSLDALKKRVETIKKRPEGATLRWPLSKPDYVMPDEDDSGSETEMEDDAETED